LNLVGIRLGAESPSWGIKKLKTPMSTFTSSACYDLSTHSIVFDQVGVEVILDSTSTKVDGASFSAGFAMMVVSGDFCFGTISPGVSFTEVISLDDPKGGFEFDDTSAPKIVGSDVLDNPSITHHNWEVEDCPIEFSLSGTDVTVKCPCTTVSRNCTNTCYSAT
jgi:hypothetical protein